MKDIYTHVGRQVRARRRALGMTIEELAEGAELHPSYIGQIERGGKKASLATVFALAEALDVPLARLFEDTPAPAKEPQKDPAAGISALLRGRRYDERQILLSMFRHLARELRELRASRR